MSPQPATLLTASLTAYVVGSVAGLLFLRREKAANVFAFGCASLAALCAAIACVLALTSGATAANQSLDLFPSLIPYVRFTVRLDPLGLFFGLIVSLLGLALSVYSLVHGRGFYRRKHGSGLSPSLA